MGLALGAPDQHLGHADPSLTLAPLATTMCLNPADAGSVRSPHSTGAEAEIVVADRFDLHGVGNHGGDLRER